ncbi:MAG: hypothetical protein AABW54_01800 [Candidatus Micrarchaeota archaeon]
MNFGFLKVVLAAFVITALFGTALAAAATNLEVGAPSLAPGELAVCNAIKNPTDRRGCLLRLLQGSTGANASASGVKAEAAKPGAQAGGKFALVKAREQRFLAAEANFKRQFAALEKMRAKSLVAMNATERAAAKQLVNLTVTGHFTRLARAADHLEAWGANASFIAAIRQSINESRKAWVNASTPAARREVVAAMNLAWREFQAEGHKQLIAGEVRTMAVGSRQAVVKVRLALGVLAARGVNTTAIEAAVSAVEKRVAELESAPTLGVVKQRAMQLNQLFRFIRNALNRAVNGQPLQAAPQATPAGA